MQVIAKVDAILAQREEILTAFVAKYGCDPDNIVQVYEMTNNGGRYWVELKHKDRDAPLHA